MPTPATPTVRPARVGELVVGRAADDPRGEGLDDVVVERAAEGTRCVHVELGCHQRGGVVHDLDLRVLRPERLDRRGVDVGDHDRGAVLDQQAREVAADLADAGDADGAAGEVRLAPGDLSRGPHALEDAVRREHGGVAGTAVLDGAPGDEVALAGDVVHVDAVGPHVARGVVATVERLDEAAVGPEEGFALQRRRVADDDGLAAAEVQAGQSGLVGHAPGEVEDVAERVVGAGVRVEARAAQRRPEGRGVDGDDRLQAGGGVVREDDLLVFGTQVEDVDGLVGAGNGVAHGGLQFLCSPERPWVVARRTAAGRRRGGAPPPA